MKLVYNKVFLGNLISRHSHALEKHPTKFLCMWHDYRIAVESKTSEKKTIKPNGMYDFLISN